MLYTPIMVSRTHQIDGLLDALSDKGAAIVRARIAVRQLEGRRRISPNDAEYLLAQLETDASETRVSSPQSS